MSAARLAAFAADAAVQAGFRAGDVSEMIRHWMVDGVYRALDPDDRMR